MSALLDWLIARLKEPSTWAGIGAVAVAIGGALQGHTDQLATVIAGALAVVLPEQGSKS